MGPQKLYKVLLLAGHRAKTNEICDHYRLRYKALAPVAGQPMIMHPLSSLQESAYISEIIVLAQEPETLKNGLGDYPLTNKVKFQAGQSTIAETVLNIWDQHDSNQGLLITTADNCLLSVNDIHDFLIDIERDESDVYIGVMEKDRLLARYPESRRTWIRFSDTQISGCNLFLLSGSNANQAIVFWKDFERRPKKILGLAWRLGPMTFWRYWREKLSIDSAFQAISTVAGSRVSPVFMRNPEIAIDADKFSDIEQIERILGHKQKKSEPLSAREKSKKPVVIFDLDRTITTFGTYAPFLLYFALRHNPLRLVFLPVILVQAILYVLKIRSRKQLKTVMFDLLIGSPEKTELLSTAAAYVERTLRKNVYTEALETIHRWRESQAKLVLATASYDWMAEIFARRLGFENVVATHSLEKNGSIIAGIKGENCYGPEKLAMVDTSIGPLAELITAGNEVWCYTDHHSDISLLAACSHPVGVNPTAKLAQWLNERANGTTVKWVKKSA